RRVAEGSYPTNQERVETPSTALGAIVFQTETNGQGICVRSVGPLAGDIRGLGLWICREVFTWRKHSRSRLRIRQYCQRDKLAKLYALYGCRALWSRRREGSPKKRTERPWRQEYLCTLQHSHLRAAAAV